MVYWSLLTKDGLILPAIGWTEYKCKPKPDWFLQCILAAICAVVCAAPAPGAVLAAPAVAAVPAPIVTASSSQVIARNYNTLAAAPLAAAPLAAAPLTYAAAPLAAAPLAAAPLATAPLTYAAAPFAAYGTHAVAPAAAYSAYSAPILLWFVSRTDRTWISP